MKRNRHTTRQAVKAFGGRNNLAKELGITRQAIAKWFKSGKLYPPSVRSDEIEKLINEMPKEVD